MSYARRLWAWIGTVRHQTWRFAEDTRRAYNSLWRLMYATETANEMAFTRDRAAKRIALRTRSRLTTTKVTVEELAALGAKDGAAKYGIPVDEVQDLIDAYGPTP